MVFQRVLVFRICSWKGCRVHHPSTSPSLIPVKMRLFAMRSMSLVTSGNAAVICCTKFFCEYGFRPHSSQYPLYALNSSVDPALYSEAVPIIKNVV